MKNIIRICGILLVFIGCSKDEIKEQQEVSIYGTWKLTEIYIGEGPMGTEWTPVENGYSYTFNADGSFTSTKFAECTYGTFAVSETTITLDFGCEGFTTEIEHPAGTFIESYDFVEDALILHPSYLDCTEGCEYKFQKVND